MTDATEMPKYDGMEYEEIVAAAQFLCMENARLRKLIADVHRALCADKTGMFHRLTLASMEYDMRELGIEVDE